MDKKDVAPESAELSGFRRQIDDIDDKIIGLLTERARAVQHIGEIKNKTAPGQCPIRPGREADMVRRIIKKCEGTPISPAAAATIWRTLIGMYTSMESPLKISVFVPERDDTLLWMAREYFGPAVPITRQPHVKRVIGDVMDGKASVGIVPMLKGSDTTYWWTNLMQQGKDVPKIFAHIPFVYQDVPGRDAASALAIARIAPEETVDDMSVLVIEADQNVSQSRLQSAFMQAKMDAGWINVATLSPATRHHLICVKGFVTPSHGALKDVIGGLGASIFNTMFLGAYAVPVVLQSNAANGQPAMRHATAAPHS